MKIKLTLARLVIFLIYAINLNLAQAKDIKIGFCNYPPFEYEESGSYKGSDVETVTAIFKKMSMNPIMTMMPWERVVDSANKGEIDGLMSIVKSPEREKIYFYSEPISFGRVSLYKRKDLKIASKPAAINDLSSYKFGIAGGYTYPKAFGDAKLPNVEVKTSDKPELILLRMLNGSRIDFMLCDANVCNNILASNSAELNNVEYYPDVTLQNLDNVYLGLIKSNPENAKLIEQFNAALKEFIDSGKRKEILDKYHMVQN